MSMNKTLMLKSEDQNFEVSKSDRPITNGGRTLAKDKKGGSWHKQKQRAVASTAAKRADKQRRDRYNASRK